MIITKKDVLVLLVLFFSGLSLFLLYTWAVPLIDPDEPRYASTACNMVSGGNWIVPIFNDAPRINKPPLFYWMIAVSYKIFGINEFSARLPSALAGIGTIFITFLMGKRLCGHRNGFWAGMILMTSPLFFFLSRCCITDMLLTFFVSAGLYLFFVEYTEANSNNLRRVLFYSFLGMAFLVKGPIGILLILMIISGFVVCLRDIPSIRKLWYLPGFLLFLGIVCAWGIPFWLSIGSEHIITLLIQETSGRFVDGYVHPEPFYYYFPVFLVGYFPWSLFVCVALIRIVKRRKTLTIKERKQVYFISLWFIITVTFFSLSRSKLMTYLLPVSPSVALLTMMLCKWEKEDIFGKTLKWLIPVLTMTFPVILIAAMVYWIPDNYKIPIYHAVIPVVILFIGSLITIYTVYHRKSFPPLFKVLCFTNSLFLISVIVLMSTYFGEFRSTKNIVRKCHLDEVENCTLFSFAKTLPSLVFYSGKNVKEMHSDISDIYAVTTETSSVYLVMTMNSYMKKKDSIPGNNFHIVGKDDAHIVLKMGNN